MPSPSTSPQVKLIATDLDGTLLSPDGRISPSNREALHLALAAGVEIVIATGRRHSYAMSVLHDAALPPRSVLISSNGAVVRTLASDPIETTYMQPAAALALCAHLGDYRNALVLTFDKLGPDGVDSRGALVVEELEDLHSSIGRWMQSNEPCMAHIRPIELALHGDPPIQMMLCGTVPRMRAAEAHILKLPGIAPVGSEASGLSGEPALIALNRTEYPDRDLSLLDILPAGCSKGTALLRLAASRGILPSEIMAIGDNWNDLSMLRVAGFPVLMGNAPEDLKTSLTAQTWTQAPPHDLDGVAYAIHSALIPALSLP